MDNIDNELFGKEEIPGEPGASNESENQEAPKVTKLSGMYENWFLDYASYVILERAVPDVKDGLKPVQKRILHSMKEMDDGRYNKVANIIGNTMKYHPHGDASIGDALVQLGQKELLIDTQGNWGNILTGDSAAAPRYIEARPSKFALDILYNPKTTVWKSSYDGRNKEPVHLPVKFPLLLAQGVEGIAVGLSSKIFPHNFNELIDASIKYLHGERPDIYPDFPTGGIADVSRYNDGLRGGKVRVRAKINILDKKTLVITEIPFATTTGSLIESILSANDKGKIKIRKIEDNTAANVEILVHLVPGISPDQAIDALYAFTDCELSLSPNSCVIDEDRPRFMSVNDILCVNTDNTLNLLKSELEIKKSELQEQWLFSSLEKIFIENRIYHDIEECETWEDVLATIDRGLEPFKKIFYRTITTEDIIKLTEIKIKRISKFDAFKADEHIRGIEQDLEKVNYHLANLIQYAIDYYTRIKEKYGKGRERKTELRSFDTIEATRVAVANAKLYVNRVEGFAGIGLKKDEFVCDCSDIDDIIVFREDGTFLVTKVSEKSFVGKNIIHIAVFNKNDERTIYNMIYEDGPRGTVFVKRFAVIGITRDKEYDLTKGSKGSKVLYLTANPNGEAERITVFLRHKPKLKKPQFDFEFSTIAIKGRAASGNILTKHAVRKISLKDQGISTLGARKLWFDPTVLKLNEDQRGFLVGEFIKDDKVLAIFPSGLYRIFPAELSAFFEEEPVLVQKFKAEEVLTAVYFDGELQQYYMKRFEAEYSDKILYILGEHPATKLLLISKDKFPMLRINYVSNDKKIREPEDINASEFIAVKGYKAKGKRLTTNIVENLEWLESLPDPDEEQIDEQSESLDNESLDLGFSENGDKKRSSEPGEQIQIELDF